DIRAEGFSHRSFNVVLSMNALVVVIDGNRQCRFGSFLTNDVVVKVRVDFLRGGQDEFTALSDLGKFFFNYLVAQLDALITNVNTGSGDEFTHLLLSLPTKGTLQQIC